MQADLLICNIHKVHFHWAQIIMSTTIWTHPGVSYRNHLDTCIYPVCMGAYGEHSSRLRNFEWLKLVTNLKETKEAKCKLDYQVSICSLIPPATAISKTQDRADTSVWWKLPFSIFFIIYYVQSPIINKVCKTELWFLCSAHPISLLYICMKFHENISNNF